MQGASPRASPTSNCLRHVQSLPYRCLRGACLLGRLPPLPLACLAAPIPPTPFPSGEGGDYRLISPGLRPRHPCIRPLAALVVPAVQEVHLRGGACPNLAGSAGVGGTLQGAAFLAACRPAFPSPPLCPIPPLAERRLGGRASQGHRPLPRAKKAPPHTRQGF